MSWVATAVIGGAVIGGIASNKASSRAAEGQENALQASTQSTAQARSDVTDLFGQAEVLQAQGFTNALDTLFGGAERQIAPFQHGNLQAQNTLLGGLQQQQNALLGNAPVDLTGLQAQSVDFQPLQRPIAPPVEANPLPGFDPNALDFEAIRKLIGNDFDASLGGFNPVLGIPVPRRMF